MRILHDRTGPFVRLFWADLTFNRTTKPTICVLCFPRTRRGTTERIHSDSIGCVFEGARADIDFMDEVQAIQALNQSIHKILGPFARPRVRGCIQ